MCGLVDATVFDELCPKTCKDGHHEVCGSSGVFSCVKHKEHEWAEELKPEDDTQTKCKHTVSEHDPGVLFDVRLCNKCNSVVCGYCNWKLGVKAGKKSVCHWGMKTGVCQTRLKGTKHLRQSHPGLHIEKCS
jgi:hypothetical protein